MSPGWVFDCERRGAAIFESGLKQAGVPVYLQTIEEGGHGGFEGPALNARLKDFFDKYLRGADPVIATGRLRVRE